MRPLPEFDPDPMISPEGHPTRPITLIPLDALGGHPPNQLEEVARLLRRSLSLTVGVLREPPAAHLRPLLEAATFTLSDTAGPLSRHIVPVPDLDTAIATLDAAVNRSPAAAIACGQLLRQTATLDTARGLAAEAAVYSTLLTGREFARWLRERGAPRPLPARTRPLLDLHRTDSHLSITLNDPDRRNALGTQLRRELFEALEFAELDTTIHTVEIRGVGPSFCSGGDLDEFGQADDVVGAYLTRLICAPWHVLDRLAERATAYVQGGCIGAGAELASFAGTVVAAPDTFFVLPEVHMGLVPGAGGTVGVTRRIGRWRAAWSMVTKQPLDAPTALAWGLVDAIDSATNVGTT